MNGDPSWRDAYNRDSHVADNYARSSHAEVRTAISTSSITEDHSLIMH